MIHPKKYKPFWHSVHGSRDNQCLVLTKLKEENHES